MKNHQGVFRLSTWDTEAGIASWFEWLRHRKIPTAIVQERDGNKFSVWRKGVESIADKAKEGPEPWDPERFTIIREANGFAATVEREIAERAAS